MSRYRLKNIIILILAVVNLLLLLLMINRVNQNRRYQAELIAGTVTALEHNGISIASDLAAIEPDFSPAAIERDTQAEASMASLLLGSCALESAGSTYTYTSPAGSVIFRGSGNFELTYATPQAAEDPREQALSLMNAAGLTCQVWEETEDTVTLVQLWDGLPVLNCQIQFCFQDGALTTVQGCRLLGSPTAVGQELLSASTALISFLGYITTSGDICREITGLYPGYQMVVSLSGAAVLQPVWRLTADSNIYTVNALTGSVTPAS